MRDEISNDLARFGALIRDGSGLAPRGSPVDIPVDIAALPLADRRLSAIPQTTGGGACWCSVERCFGAETAGPLEHALASAVRHSPRSLLMIDRQITALTLIFTARALKANNSNIARGCLEGGFRDGCCFPGVLFVGATQVSRHEGEATMSSAEDGRP